MSLIIRHMKSSASEIGLEFTFDLTIVSYIEITSWLVSAYDFYSRVVKNR